MVPRNLPRFLLVVYMLSLMTLTLFILAGKQPTLNLIPFRAIARDWRCGGQPLVINFWGNILAFVPFGLLVSLVRVRPTKAWQAVLLAGSLSLLIETLQYIYAKRNADIDDVILNALGGLLGHGLLRLWEGSAARFFTREVSPPSSKPA